jgi:hypothetical protein
MTNLLDLMARGVSGVSFELAPLAKELVAYGEPETAAWLLGIDSDTHAKISVQASQYLAGNIIDKAICLAAVEIFEGNARPLRRKRRMYSKSNG